MIKRSFKRQPPDVLEQVDACVLAQDYDNAIFFLKKELGESPVVHENSKLLLYRLGGLYEAQGLLREALGAYGYVLEEDYLYKDIKDRVFRIQERLKKEETRTSRYELLGEVGRGGMGVVLKARDNELGRTVALKVISSYLLFDVHMTERFIREAKIAASLNHPHIAQVYDVVDFKGSKAICMEYVEGRSLRKMMDTEGKISEAQLVPVALQILKALEHAHRHGVVHRDVKPDNILLTADGSVKLTDFGIARVLDGGAGITLDGKALGTPAYFSPEQISGDSVDTRSDMYSLGVTLYEALSGKPLFYQGNVVFQHLHAEPERLPQVSERLQTIIMTCLRKRKEERYSDCVELMQALEA